MRFLSLLLGSALVACAAESGTAHDESDLTTESAARNCELFVDQVGVSSGSFGYEGIDLFVKLLPERLDGEVQEVGFRHRVCAAETGCTDRFVDKRFFPHEGARDYFEGHLEAYTWRSGERKSFGSFYVRTTKHTYWLNSHGRAFEDFTFDRGTNAWLRGLVGGADGKLATQSRDDLSYLNPQRCF